MKPIAVPLAGFGLLLLGSGTVSAASPTYCALYAKEYVKRATIEAQGSVPGERVHDRAYHKCLNMDDEPPLPTAYSDPGSDGVGGPLVEAEGSVAAPVEEAAVGAVTVDPTIVDESIVKQTAILEGDVSAPAPKGKRRGSGLAMWSPEWKKWCARHFPKSFDPKTGTIIPYNTGKRTICR